MKVRVSFKFFPKIDPNVLGLGLGLGLGRLTRYLGLGLRLVQVKQRDGVRVAVRKEL